MPRCRRCSARQWRLPYLRAIPRSEQEVVVGVAVIPGGVQRTTELNAIVLCVRSVGIEIGDGVAKVGCRTEPEDVLNIVIRRARIDRVSAIAADQQVGSGPAVQDVSPRTARESVGSTMPPVSVSACAVPVTFSMLVIEVKPEADGVAKLTVTPLAEPA